MRTRRYAAIVMVIAMVGGCGGNGSSEPDKADKGAASRLFPDSFKGVCAGAGVATATAFDPGATTHKALLFQTYGDDLQDQSHRLPPAWTVTFSPNSNALAAIDVVVCSQRTAEKLVKTCDGYKTDGKATGNEVRWHTATYEVSVHEAKTGKKLASDSVEATDETCPMFASFDGEGESIDMHATLSDTTLTEFAKPFAQR